MTGHDHDHGRGRDVRRLRIALAVTAAILVAEAAGGILSGSLALLADAGHMLTDAAALVLSLFAFRLSSRPMSARRTFGWKRFEILAALVNGLVLWGAAAVIAAEAIRRLRAPVEIRGGLMLAVAVLGLAANAASAVVLYGGKGRSLNVKGAFLHVVFDAVGSLGVIAAALVISLTGWTLADPIISLAVCLLIVWGSGRLVRESLHVLLEGAPGHLDVEAIKTALSGLPGVSDVHDLHVWTVTSEFVSLTAHLALKPRAGTEETLASAQALLADRFGISHSTLQLETADGRPCRSGTCEGV